MVQTFVPAEQLTVGTLVYVSPALGAKYPELARKVTAVTKLEDHGHGTIHITLAALPQRPIGVAPWARMETLPIEEQRPLGELQAMTADDLSCHALAYVATNRWNPYAALVVGLLAMELDEDEPDVAERIQTAADELVAA